MQQEINKEGHGKSTGKEYIEGVNRVVQKYRHGKSSGRASGKGRERSAEETGGVAGRSAMSLMHGGSRSGTAEVCHHDTCHRRASAPASVTSVEGNTLARNSFTPVSPLVSVDATNQKQSNSKIGCAPWEVPQA